jgi:diacylglycerol O-acyltransferase / wax synthase
MMAQHIQLDTQMSDAEGLMWRLEKDPYLSSTVANITILDRSPDFEQFKARMERAALAIPRLRQRVQAAPGNLSAPHWVDDSSFDIDYHVRHLAIPEPGSMEQVTDVATLIAIDPFERTRPLWQFTVVDGLADGRSAIIQKMHHAIADGEGLMRLSLQYLDLVRDSEPVDRVTDSEWHAAAAHAGHPRGGDALTSFVTGSFKLPLAMMSQIRGMIADPASIPSATTAISDSVRGVIAQLSDTDAARSPLWTKRSLGRHLATLRVPLTGARDASKRLGGTLNTLFITAAADGAGAYHRHFGAPVDNLRASMAISTRTSESKGNAFSLARLLVPTGEMSVEDRFQAIQLAAGVARHSQSAGSLDTLAKVATALPTSLITRLARQQAQTIDFATSNVRGAPVPMFIAGSQLLENYPIGPLAGVAFNLTALSYADSFDMGLHTDKAAVEHPEVLCTAIESAFARLLDS